MRKMKTCLLTIVACWLACVLAVASEPDVLVADFEWQSWDDSGWTVTGEAFGSGPAKGTLPNQMKVTGYQGQRLVNSFYGGDRSTGTLTSPEFKIERSFVNFLIGGGGHPETIRMNLLIDDQVVRTATGPNTEPGGSETLDWHAWDVSELIGSNAVVQIVDNHRGGWGHINVDQIVQSDRKIELVTLGREWIVDQPYLHLPVKDGAPKRLMRMIVDGTMVRQFEIELAEGEPDFWTYTEVDAFENQTLRVEVDQIQSDSAALQTLTLSNAWPDADAVYQETLRPQFHFSPARGWMNDPNGMVFYDGEYHLFFQHNPFGTRWGNMTWGHAVSKDMVHWRQLPDAIHMDELGTIFSGAAVVDHDNTTGWQANGHQPIVSIYTSAGGTSAQSQGQPFTQSIAYSIDRGRSFAKLENNPVLEHLVGGNRDPKVIWHEPTKQWVMILYLERPRFAFFGSPDLKQWTKLSELELPGGHECPDLFELSVDGDSQNTRWVVWEAAGRYLIGSFDGTVFTPESEVLESSFGANDYAAQTFSDVPDHDGRRIQMAWMRGGQYPGMPFNQQMTVPRVLTLRTTPDGIRLFMEPVDELSALRESEHRWANIALGAEATELDGVTAELLDIEAVFDLGDCETVGLDIHGQRIEYSVATQKLNAVGRQAPLKPIEGRITLRILVDRTSIELFANGGRVQIANCFLPEKTQNPVAIFATGGEAKADSVVVWELRSIWKRD